jgi:hypothetical protein
MRSCARATFLAAILVATSSNAPAGHNADASVGFWMTRSTTLHYRATTTRYACGEIRNRVARILRTLGATPGIAIHGQCTDFDLLQTLHITATIPVDATTENIEEASAHESERELVYRLRGETPPPIEFFQVVSRRTELFRHPKLRLHTGDCELVASLERQVFPDLGIVREGRRVMCSGSATAIRPRVTFVSLFPASEDPSAELSS